MQTRHADNRDLLRGAWWFPLRKYLPGWGLPVCWQGWMVLGGYLALLFGPCPFLPGRPEAHVAYAAYAIVLTGVLGAAMWRKGERIR